MLGQTCFSKIHAEQLEGKIGSRLMQAMCSGVYCWYFVTSTSDTMSFSLILVTTSEMPGTGANNASTFHIAIVGNKAIMNMNHFASGRNYWCSILSREYSEVSFIFPQRRRRLNCVGRQNELISMEYSSA